MPTPCDSYLRAKIGLSANVTAEYGLLVADVYNAYANSPANLRPPALNGSLLDRLQTEGQVIGYLVARDAVINEVGSMIFPQAKACYGALIRDFDGAYVIAIRGTACLREWCINAETSLVPHPANPKCMVEQGFWSVYSSMQFVPVSANPPVGGGQSLIDALVAAIGNNSVVVAGHSLGAAIATYLAFDLTPRLSKCQVVASFFASPRVGDQAFADAFDSTFQQQQGRYVVINYDADAVPTLPPQGAFAPLPSVLTLTSRDGALDIDTALTVHDDYLCNHHVICYAAMLSSASVAQYALDAGVSATWASLLAANRDQGYCLRSPDSSGGGGTNGG